MRPIKDYSKARIAWATAGVTVIVQTLAIGTRALLKLDRSSGWSPLITGLIAALVVVTVVNYYSKQGRDKELLPRVKSRTRN